MMYMTVWEFVALSFLFEVDILVLLFIFYVVKRIKDNKPLDDVP